ncbi:hypothetical protein [Paenibacillus sp. NPDC058071]|uniref:hypothetical protein n=1 Tax=Paenibacillus sp. NPDC058071 TaxID=3346326 RepID=UPI0036D815FC
MTTKKRNKKSIAAIGAVLLAVALTVSACGSGNDKPLGNANTGANENQPADTELNGSGNDENVGSENTQNDDSSTDNGNSGGVTDPGNAKPDAQTGSDKGSSSAKSEEGTYGGQVDSHSIEVMTSNGPLVLQITDAQQSELDMVSPDAKIKFTYSEKTTDGQTQLWLEKLEKQ